MNGEGRIKLVGVAQHISRHSFHLGAVVTVFPSETVTLAIETAYHIMGLDFEPRTMGAVSDLANDITFTLLRHALLEALSLLLPKY